METARKIYRNTSFLAVAEVISKAIQFAVMILAARILLQEEFGRFTFALSLSFIAMILSDMGVNQYIIREIAKDKKGAASLLLNGAIIKLALCLVTLLLLLFFMEILGWDDGTKSVALIIWLFAILSTYTELFCAIFRGFECMGYDAIVKISRMALLGSLAISVLFFDGGIVLFSLCFVLSEFFALLLGFFMAKKTFLPSLFNAKISLKKMYSLLLSASPFGIAFVFSSIYFYIAAIILGEMRGEVEVALFSSAYTLALALLFIPTIYTGAIYPVLSRYHAKKEEGLKTLYARSYKYLLIIALPISILLYTFSEGIITLLYGGTYSRAGIVLAIISGYLTLKFLNFLNGFMLAAIDRQKERMVAQGVTALGSIILNIIFIGMFGFVGAAIATLACEVLLFIIYQSLVSRSFSCCTSYSEMIRPLLCGGVLLFAMNAITLPFFVLLPLGGAIYLLSLFMIGAFDSKDIEIAKGIFGYGLSKKE